MDQKLQAKYEARARVIKAMAHPTRLFIVDELARAERCVQDLTKLIGADISTVSKHLSVLKGAGIVGDEKRGTQVFYRLEKKGRLVNSDLRRIWGVDRQAALRRVKSLLESGWLAAKGERRGRHYVSGPKAR